MLQHAHDENNAPNQADDAKPSDPNTALAHGVPGAEPPLENKGPNHYVACIRA